MIKHLSISLLVVALSAGGASAASVMPVFTNDTAANTLSFNDTFGHQVSIGNYNPATGIWMVPTGSITGTTGGVPFFPNSTTFASSGALGASQIVLGGGAAGPSTPVGLGTTTQVLHGNAAGAPSYTAITSADVTAVLASPPPIGNTVANTGAFSTLSATGLSTLTTINASGLVALTGSPNSLTAANNVFFQGFLSISPTNIALNSQLYLAKAQSGTFSLITGETGSLARWQLELGDGATESGSNAGSNFNINSYNDAGGFIAKWLSITRSNGLFTYIGSIAQNPITTEGSGVVPGIYQQYAATGSTGTAASAAINVFDLSSDNLTVSGAPGNAFLTLLSVYDLAFGGAATTGGRIAGDFDITQSAITESTHTFRAYVGLHGTVITSSGDGGGAGTEKGQYYGMWASTILGASAAHVQSVQGLEVDMTAVAGSSVLYKAGISIGGTAGGGVDAVQGSIVDTLIWFGSCNTCVGSKNGLLFGSTLGTTGIATTGTVLGFYPVATTIATGIDLTAGGNMTISGNAWSSPGASITGAGRFFSTGTETAGFQVSGTKSVAGIYDASTAPYGIQLAGTYANAPIYATGIIQTTGFIANAAVATVLGSLGPTGSHTTVQEWIEFKDTGGTIRYVPAF